MDWQKKIAEYLGVKSLSDLSPEQKTGLVAVLLAGRQSEDKFEFYKKFDEEIAEATRKLREKEQSVGIRKEIKY